MISIVRNANKYAYGVNDYVIDKEEEKQDLHCAIGSTVYVNASHKTYKLVQANKWVVMSTESGGSSTEPAEESEPFTEEEILALLEEE